MKSLFSRNGIRTTLAAGALAAQPLHADTPRRVVLIHGIWDTFHTMRKMERVLREAGYEPFVLSLTPNGGQRPLDDLGAQVDRQVRKHIPDGERFSIIGFSMGGLVARSYMRQFGEPKRIATFVSIGSPHRGTWLAWLDGNPGIRDMRPRSAFLTAIDADAARYSDTRWVTIRTPADLMILPSHSSVLPWATNHSFPVIAHALLVLDGRVLRCILSSLGDVSTKSALEPLASPHAESHPRRTPGIPRHR